MFFVLLFFASPVATHHLPLYSYFHRQYFDWLFTIALGPNALRMPKHDPIAGVKFDREIARQITHLHSELVHYDVLVKSGRELQIYCEKYKLCRKIARFFNKPEEPIFPESNKNAKRGTYLRYDMGFNNNEVDIYVPVIGASKPRPRNQDFKELVLYLDDVPASAAGNLDKEEAHFIQWITSGVITFIDDPSQFAVAWLELDHKKLVMITSNEYISIMYDFWENPENYQVPFSDGTVVNVIDADFDETTDFGNVGKCEAFEKGENVGNRRRCEKRCPRCEEVVLGTGPTLIIDGPPCKEATSNVRHC